MSTTTDLLYDNSIDPATEVPLAIRARLLGVLADLAWPIVEHYRSDLYHDVHWLDEYFTSAPFAFTFGARQWGTSIGFDAELVMFGNDHVWQVTCYADGYQWRVDVEPVKGEAQPCTA